MFIYKLNNDGEESVLISSANCILTASNEFTNFIDKEIKISDIDEIKSPIRIDGETYNGHGCLTITEF